MQQSLGLDRVPEPLRSEVIDGQAIRQELVLGYWDELLKGEYEWSSIGKQLRQKGLVK